MREVARYRVSYEVNDPADAIGPRPAEREQQRAWERAHEAIGRSERRHGRGIEAGRGADVGIGRQALAVSCANDRLVT